MYSDSLFLTVRFTDAYPFAPPILRFITPVYHCNVGADGAVNLQFDGWSPAMTLRTLLISITAFLTDPNPDDACCIAVGRGAVGDMYRNDRAGYDAAARDWTQQHARPP
eukprot:COSAG01_NODE_34693_length_543_cov_1.560811_1_plen_109_part_00